VTPSLLAHFPVYRFQQGLGFAGIGPAELLPAYCPTFLRVSTTPLACRLAPPPPPEHAQALLELSQVPTPLPVSNKSQPPHMSTPPMQFWPPSSEQRLLLKAQHSASVGTLPHHAAAIAIAWFPVASFGVQHFLRAAVELSP
jgi:hypothetical protein